MTIQRASKSTVGQQLAGSGIEPRGLSRIQAASYLGISASLFDDMVRDRRMPGPKRLGGRTVWDRRQLDAAFDALPNDRARHDDVNDEWDARV